MIIILDQFSNNKDNSKTKIVIIAFAIKNNIPILKLYKEAINYPRYSKYQQEAIKYKIS